MDPLNILVGVAIIVALILAFIAWKAHQNHVSITDELKLLRPALADHVTALTEHALSLETHAEAIKQSAQPNVPGVTIDPQPNTIVIRHEFPAAAPPQVAAAAEPAPPAKSDPVSTFLGTDTGAPAQPAVQGRDAMRDGPIIITPYVAALNRPDLDTKIGRIAQWWAQSGSTIDDAIAVVEADKDQPEAYQQLAAGQKIRDDQANVAGVDFKGFVDVARLSLDDGFYLSAMAGRYAALTGQGSIWTAMLYGSATACNAFINMINSTNAGRLGTYDVNSYQGQMKALVEAKIGGNT